MGKFNFTIFESFNDAALAIEILDKTEIDWPTCTARFHHAIRKLGDKDFRRLVSALAQTNDEIDQLNTLRSTEPLLTLLEIDQMEANIHLCDSGAVFNPDFSSKINNSFWNQGPIAGLGFKSLREAIDSSIRSIRARNGGCYKKGLNPDLF